MKPLDSLSDDEFSQLMRQAVAALPDAPAALQRAAIGLWPAAGGKALLGAGLLGVAQAVLNQIQAVLSFDSWNTPALATGMRSLRSPTRHLLYSAQGRDIDLRLSPSADAFALAGQILGPDDSGAVELRSADAGPERSHRAALDELGEFRIDGLAPGNYQLTLRMGSDEILLPPLQVGPPN